MNATTHVAIAWGTSDTIIMAAIALAIGLFVTWVIRSAKVPMPGLDA